MKIQARVTDGLGKGAQFISIPIYEEIFSKLLGKKPYYGTLNLVTDPNSAIEVSKAFMRKGELHEGLEWKGKKLGAIETLPAKLWVGDKVTDVILVRPALTEHRRSVIEIVAIPYLREELSLVNGSKIELELVI